MESNRYQTIADDVNVLKGKCTQIFCNLMRNALKLLSSWADSCGLSINPMKTELVLLSHRYKVPNLTPPRFGNIRNSAKFLGVILDKKLL